MQFMVVRSVFPISSLRYRHIMSDAHSSMTAEWKKKIVSRDVSQSSQFVKLLVVISDYR